MSVSANPEVVIKDACILFDLIDLGLLDKFYSLNLVVMATAGVLSEIIDPVQLEQVNVHITSGRLQIETPGVYEDLSQIIDNNPGLSFTDASVLELATRRKATMLSSDKSLRNEAQRRGLTVRGMLWILEELHVQGIVTVNEFLEKLDCYPQVNPRAPKTHIENLKKKYQQPKP